MTRSGWIRRLVQSTTNKNDHVTFKDFHLSPPVSLIALHPFLIFGNSPVLCPSNSLGKPGACENPPPISFWSSEKTVASNHWQILPTDRWLYLGQAELWGLLMNWAIVLLSDRSWNCVTRGPRWKKKWKSHRTHLLCCTFSKNIMLSGQNITQFYLA